MESNKNPKRMMDLPPYKLFPDTDWRHEVNEIIKFLNENFNLTAQNITFLIESIDGVLDKVITLKYNDLHPKEGELLIAWGNALKTFLRVVNHPVYRFLNIKWNSKFFTMRETYHKAVAYSLWLLARTTAIGMSENAKFRQKETDKPKEDVMGV